LPLLLLLFTLQPPLNCPTSRIARPRITGISHIAVYTSNPAATDHFYREIVGAVKQPDPENPKGVRYASAPRSSLRCCRCPRRGHQPPRPHGMEHDDAEACAAIWIEGVEGAGPGGKGRDGSRWFTSRIPKATRSSSFSRPRILKPLQAPNAIGHHIIHVGFLVHSRAVEDTFYRDLLGFKPYWLAAWSRARSTGSASRLPTATTGWNTCSPAAVGQAGIPADMSQHDLGVLDHFSIGEDSVPAAYKVLKDAATG
jgi:hypothetical protein